MKFEFGNSKYLHFSVHQNFKCICQKDHIKSIKPIKHWMDVLYILIYVSEKYLLEIIAISILFIALKEIIGAEQALKKCSRVHMILIVQ